MSNLSQEKEERPLFAIFNQYRFVLRLTGFWPDENFQKSFWWKFKGLAIFFFSVAMATLQLIMMVVYYTDIRSAIGDFFDAATMILVNLRLALFLSRRNTIFELAKRAEKLLAINKNVEECSIMDNWYSHQSKMSKYLGIVYASVILVWFTSSLISGSGLSIGTHLPSYFYEAPLFYVAFFSDLFITTFALAGLLTEDIFATFFVCHLCGELACIASNLKKFGSQDYSPSLVKKIIGNHMTALDYGNDVCQLFSMVLYIEMIPFMIGTCASVFTANLDIHPAITASAIAVSVICISRVFVICFIGETLLQESHEIHNAVTESYWYLCDSKDRKAIQMILIQAQKPILLRVGTLGIINLRYFSVFIFNAYSYFTVLRTALEH